MSRGNYFVSPNTKHYFYIPALFPYGLAYLDAATFNILRNPNNSIAQQAREITSRSEVNIYRFDGFIGDWLNSHCNCKVFYYRYINQDGDEVSGDVWTTVPEDTSEGVTSIPTIGELINYVEYTSYEQQLQDIKDENRFAEVLVGIQSSIDGHLISGSVSLRNKNDDMKIRAFFPRRYANRNDRTLAVKGTQLIQDVPRLASGRKIHFKGSRDSPVGEYNSDEGLSVEDPAATVSGPLKTRWNNNLGVFESSQTFLALLLTDVDGADIKKSDFTLANVEGSPASDWYGKDAVHKIWQFTTGMAAPLSLESSQPQSFGPNIINCAGQTKTETIRVVNRGRTNYSQGEIVIIHQIDGENIIGGKFSEQTLEQRPPQAGRWNFTKFFANSDEYFRIEAGEKYGGRPPVLPSEVVDILYQKNYNYLVYASDKKHNRLKDEATVIDRKDVESAKLFQYYQSAISDIASYLKRINIYVDPEDQGNVGTDNVEQRTVPLFFGPMFPDGVQSMPKGWTGNDKYQVPGEYVYPFFYDAHGAIRQINSASNLTGELYYGSTDEYTTSGIIPVGDLKHVQFSLCSCELLGAGDNAAIQMKSNIGSRGRFGSADTDPRNFPKTIQRLTGGKLVGEACGQLTRPAVDRRYGGNGLNEGKVKNKFDNGAMAAMYRGFDAPNGIENIIPYDAYIDYVPLNSPKNAPALFGGDTGPESTVTAGEEFLGGQPGQYVGSNAVGITSARLKMNQGSGGSWNLGVEVDQTFGMKGRFFGGGGGGSITATIIGSILAFANDTRGRTIQGSVPMWGSNKNDSIDSFGTAACHIQVWDAWPDEYTTWIPQYMCALHFNPSLDRNKDPNRNTKVKMLNYQDAEKKSDGDWAVKPKEVEIELKKASAVSFPVPTYGERVKIEWTDESGEAAEQEYVSYGHGQDGQDVGLGVFKGTLRPQNLWNLNTSREGQLVTQRGYHYFKRVIGLGEGRVVEIDDDFQGGEKNVYTIGRGDKEAQVYINDYKKVLFHKIEWENNSEKKQDEYVRGEGYLPSDIPVRATITDANGKKAKLEYYELFVYDKHYHDVGPRARSALTRVTQSSGSGTDRAFGPSSKSIAVEGNRIGADTDLTLYSGQYEVYVYVHNDVGFAWHEPPETTTGLAMAQYITIKLL